jgi:hypothetical protein
MPTVSLVGLMTVHIPNWTSKLSVPGVQVGPPEGGGRSHEVLLSMACHEHQGDILKFSVSTITFPAIELRPSKNLLWSRNLFYAGKHLCAK